LFPEGGEAAGAYGLIGTFPGGVVSVYKGVYADSLRTVCYVMTGIAGFGLLVILGVGNESLDRGISNSKQGFKAEREEENGEVV
jgi:uncharacterized membrane protein YuzA (DUF378 family)